MLPNVPRVESVSTRDTDENLELRQVNTTERLKGRGKIRIGTIRVHRASVTDSVLSYQRRVGTVKLPARAVERAVLWVALESEGLAVVRKFDLHAGLMICPHVPV
jgi:hypothetical protein